MKDEFSLGRLIAPARPSLIKAALGLFNPRRSSEVACDRFLTALRLRRPVGPEVFARNGVHMVVIAPTGSGKGVSVVIPRLLSCPDSQLVFDPKGELFKITAVARRKMGNAVYALDPFKIVTAHPATLNPLATLSKDDPESLDIARAMADAMAEFNPNERDPHWRTKAMAFISGAITGVVQFSQSADQKNLQTVADVLAKKEMLAALTEALCSSDKFGGLVARIGNEISQSVDKELAGILSTVNRYLAFLSTPAVSDSTRTSDFDPSLIARTPMTVFMVIPPIYIRSHAPLIRLWVTTFLRAIAKGGVRS